MCCCGQSGLAVPQNPSSLPETFPEAAGHRSQLMGCRSQETACHNKLGFLCSDDPQQGYESSASALGKCIVVASKRKGVVGGMHKALSYSGLHQCGTPDHVESISATNLSCLWMPGQRLDNSSISLSVFPFLQHCTSAGPSSVGKWWLCPTPFLSPVAS